MLVDSMLVELSTFMCIFFQKNTFTFKLIFTSLCLLDSAPPWLPLDIWTGKTLCTLSVFHLSVLRDNSLPVITVQLTTLATAFRLLDLPLELQQNVFRKACESFVLRGEKNCARSISWYGAPTREISRWKEYCSD